MARSGVVFDFDGTIALSEHVHQEAWVELASEWGQTLPAGFLEKAVGATDEALSKELARIWRRPADELTILSKKRRYYQSRCRTDSILVPGIDRFLRRLDGVVPVGLATSASIGDITPTLEAYGLMPFFQVVLTIESVTNPKPHPEIYLTASERLGIDPKASFVFEDSPMGTAAARAAGMSVIGMTTTFPVEHIGPVLAGIPDYQDLALIERLLSLGTRS